MPKTGTHRFQSFFVSFSALFVSYSPGIDSNPWHHNLFFLTYNNIYKKSLAISNRPCYNVVVTNKSYLLVTINS